MLCALAALAASAAPALPAAPIGVADATLAALAALAPPAAPARRSLPPSGAAVSFAGLTALASAARPEATRRGGADPDPEALRRDLLRLLDEQRAAAGAPALRFSAPLARAAQQHVEEIVARGSLRGEQQPEDAMERRLRGAGYDARQWAENLMSGPVTAAQLVSAWREDDSDGTFRRLLDPAYTDLGIGVGRLADAPLYSILFALPQSEAFARETAGLRDLERVRAEVLARINAARRSAGRQPLTLDSRLTAAAQRHAEDMLARSYFGHLGPDGKTVRERARASGYDWAAIGENLAEGQQSAKEAVESWMRSAGHRENILDRRYIQTGVGLAFGRDSKTGDYRILWVQTFGLPR
jgi:uncharacterized protein YkwD